MGWMTHIKSYIDNWNRFLHCCHPYNNQSIDCYQVKLPTLSWSMIPKGQDAEPFLMALQHHQYPKK